MKIVLAALDAKYIHTNPAVRGIAAFAAEKGVENIHIAEFTINHRARQILEALYQLGGDIYLFSAYIWNIELIKTLAADLRRLLPRVIIGVGGPQVSYHSKDFLRDHPAFDLVVAGEGEETCTELFSLLRSGLPWRDCPGILTRRGDKITTAPPRPPVDMDSIPFVYRDLPELSGRVLYYESMRGCPFSCSYCLSSVEKGVRFRSLDLVFADLQRFLDQDVPQVKFVDRTFNCDKGRALAIWRFLAERDNGKTNFHFELAAELLDDESIQFLSTVRPGLFQFEIGVQSTNTRTLREIRRPWNFEKLSEQVKALQQAGNIHLHLDLIAGLPHENLESFAHSFNDVYSLGPDQLQLGFLKVLPGSLIEEKAEEYDLAYSATAPFQVLKTRWLGFDELCLLEGITRMVETYCNSGRFGKTVAYLCEQFPSPYDFYKALWNCFVGEGYTVSPPSKIDYYRMLRPFAEGHGIPVTDTLKWLCKYDIVAWEKPRKLPEWVDVDLSRKYGSQILEFYADIEHVRTYLPHYLGEEPKRIARLAHLEVFPFHPDTGEELVTAVLFDYPKRKRHFFTVSDEGIGKIL